MTFRCRSLTVKFSLTPKYITTNKDIGYYCIPDECKDYHLSMVPDYASPMRECGIRGFGLHEVIPPYEIRRPSGIFPWHIALISLSGYAEFKCDGKRGTIEPNQIWVGPSNIAHHYYAKGNWKFVSVALHETNTFAHLEGKLLHRDLMYNSKSLYLAAQAYMSESGGYDSANSKVPQGLSVFLADNILRELVTDSDKGHSRIRIRLDQLWEEVNANPGADWRLENLAKRMHVSVRHFQRMIRENYGLTTEAMLMRIRMENARELISFTDFTLSMVSDRIGYQCVYSFSKAFKRYFSIPPGAYRKSVIDGVRKS